MKLCIAYPATGLQITLEVDDDKKLLPFFERRMGQEVPADSLGDEFKGYVLRITGGNDKQGFPMLQGVMATGRVRLLMKKGFKCYRQRRKGEMKRKSIRGCIVTSNISALHLVVVKQGDLDIPGLTDGEKPRRLGPKRASRIRKLFNLDKSDDVRKYVVKYRRAIEKDGKVVKQKSPKIQRLVTDVRLKRKEQRYQVVKDRRARSEANTKAYREMMKTHRQKLCAEKSKKVGA